MLSQQDWYDDKIADDVSYEDRDGEQDKEINLKV